eukprot:SAG31_NODE_8977_length_1354_cov_1.075697_2_plen_86_part_00
MHENWSLFDSGSYHVAVPRWKQRGKDTNPATIAVVIPTVLGTAYILDPECSIAEACLNEQSGLLSLQTEMQPGGTRTKNAAQTLT